MKTHKPLDDASFLFGALFSAANGLQVLLDRELAPYGLTAKQWYLSAVIDTFFETPPTLKAVAAIMDNSHQNVKQVALKLQEKGFLELRPDERDGRVTRLWLTDQSRSFWATLDNRRDMFMGNLFRDMPPGQLQAFRQAMTALLGNLDAMKGETP